MIGGMGIPATVLGGLLRPVFTAVLALLLVAVLALAFVLASLLGIAGSILPQRAQAAQVGEIPLEQQAVMQQAARQCDLPWQILAAVARIESDFGRNMATSSAGAIGYGQFLPSTWSQYGNGGNPYDYHDALPAMARYLCAMGGPQHLHQALWAYNHDQDYVDAVLAQAAAYGYDPGSGADGSRVVALARSQLGQPYVWGGASVSTGFDCSGLVRWIYAQAGVALPRTAQQQYDATRRLDPADLAPGDLVFFASTYPSVDRITHVGIYIGHGMMINAPQEGDVVREIPVFSGYWGRHYAGGGRVQP